VLEAIIAIVDPVAWRRTSRFRNGGTTSEGDVCFISPERQRNENNENFGLFDINGNDDDECAVFVTVTICRFLGFV